jgi:FLVCR family MFS transporter 7
MSLKKLKCIDAAYAASHPSPPLSDFIRAWFGLSHSSGAHMSGRERIDFTLLCVTFSVLVAATTTFSNLSNQYFVRPLFVVIRSD